MLKVMHWYLSPARAEASRNLGIMRSAMLRTGSTIMDLAALLNEEPRVFEVMDMSKKEVCGFRRRSKSLTRLSGTLKTDFSSSVLVILLQSWMPDHIQPFELLHTSLLQ